MVQKKRILHISQDGKSCELIRTLLELNHYESVFARTVSEGLRLASDESVRLVIYDWNIQNLEEDHLRCLVEAVGILKPVICYTCPERARELNESMGGGLTSDLVDLMKLITFYLQMDDNQ